MKPTVGILIPEKTRNIVLPENLIERLRKFSNVKLINFDEMIPEIGKDIIKSTDACITGWGSGTITPEMLELAPNLKIIAHAAGSVKGLVCSEGIDKGIKVTSSATANGISVAEHTLGLIITSLKRVPEFSNLIRTRSNKLNFYEEMEPGLKKVKALYNIKIGIIGAGYIGRYLINLLKCFQVKVLLYDPFVSYEEAKKMGVEKIDELKSLMAQVDILSLHAPSISSTHHMINKDNLSILKEDTIIINTARGSLIDETALYEEMKNGKFTAYLDVTDPEPMCHDNPLRTLPNVYLTPHIAGARFNDGARMGENSIEEIQRLFSGEPLLYEVNIKELEHRA